MTIPASKMTKGYHACRDSFLLVHRNQWCKTCRVPSS